MKKSFPLEHPRHAPARVVEQVKHEVRKYLKRERRKVLPEEADYWAFDCRVGQDGPQRVVHVDDLTAAIDGAAEQGWSSVYIEILAKPAKREPRAGAADADSDGNATDDDG